MEISIEKDHVATLSQPPQETKEPEIIQETQKSDQESETTEQELSKTQENAPEVTDDQSLNAQSILDKAKKYSKKAKSKQFEEAEKTNEILSKELTYAPNVKFSVLGKEYEIPKWAQSAIKDATSEKEVREVFEKAMGLEHVKQRHQELYQKNQGIEQNFKALDKEVGDLRRIYQESVSTGNLLGLDEFFGKLKIPTNVLLHYLNQKIQLDQMPPEQKQMFEASMTAQRRARELEMQNQELQTGATQASSQAKAMQLHQVLESPDVSAVVQSFDSSPGRKPGAFWDLVKEHGEYTWFKSQVDLTPEEAVKQVIAKLGLSVGVAQNAQTPTQTQVQSSAPKAAPSVSAHRNVPTLPSVNSKGASPVQQKVKSLEDIVKYRKDKYENRA